MHGAHGEALTPRPRFASDQPARYVRPWRRNEGRRVFRTFAALAAVAGLSLTAQAAQAQSWVKAESPNFVVYAQTSPDAARRYTETLEVFDQLLRSSHGLDRTSPVRRKLPIYVVARRQELQKVAPGIGEGVAGFYLSTPEETYAVALAGRSEDAVILHEYVHHFMRQNFPAGYPAWLSEGYAEYFMTFDRRDDVLEVGGANGNRAGWLLGGRWLPTERLLDVRPADLRDDRAVAMFYAQSWAMTHYFLSDPARRAQLTAYLAAVQTGTKPGAAFQQSFGVAPAAFEPVLRQYLKRFPSTRFNSADYRPPRVDVAALPASADLLLPALRVKSAGGDDDPQDKSDGPALLADVRRLSARHPGDRLADLTLARAEAKLGDLAKAETLLQARLKADPNDIEVLEILAFARLRAASAADAPAERSRLLAEARDYAGRAHKLSPDHYQTLIAYLRARVGVPGFPTENDANVAVDAVELAPHVGQLRLLAANVLLSRERYADAAVMLRPLALSPHQDRQTEAARRLLARAESGGGEQPGRAPLNEPTR